MTKPTRAFLYYLRRYLAAHPEKKKTLAAIHHKQTGAKLSKVTHWRHVKLISEPTMTHTIVYLTFLHRERAIVLGKKTADPLFTYAHPELLRAAKTL